MSHPAPHTTAAPPLAYRADPRITKDVFVAEMVAHREADRLVAGQYWQDGRGCAVGCGLATINARTGQHHDHGSHQALADALGIPVGLVQLEDLIFEGLPAELRGGWPERFARAIPEGANLGPAWGVFAARMLREIAIPAAGDDERVREAVESVVRWHGGAWADVEPACSAAWSAARSAAESAAWSAARSAARSAACSAARSAAESAARSAAESAAESAAYTTMADILCEALSSAAPAQQVAS